MANLKLKRVENLSTNFYVDSTCIDCGTCYWMAPSVFKDVNDQSAAVNDPQNALELTKAYQSLYACPVNSIGVVKKDTNANEVVESFPIEIAPTIYLTGFHSEKSFGATSYFIKRPKGNILIDSPRYLKKLELKFEQLGGIKFQLLTHKDDVADTDLYCEKFQSTRYIHADDTNARTSKYEVLWNGESDTVFDQDLIVIPTPGHTKGSVCFLYQQRYLFTGDHLCFSPKRNHLIAFKDANWYRMDTQIKSLEKLLNYDFEYVLPGHGAPIHLDKKEMKNSLKQCIEFMKN